METRHHVLSMAKMIQLRNIPDAVYEALKTQAEIAGMSLSDYLLIEIREIAERPTLAELQRRLGNASTGHSAGLRRQRRTRRTRQPVMVMVAAAALRSR